MKIVLFCILCAPIFVSAMQPMPSNKKPSSSARTRRHNPQPRSNTSTVQTMSLNPNKQQKKQLPDKINVLRPR